MSENEIPSDEWWEARRLHYNAALVIAGLTAFVVYSIFVDSLCADADIEITIFTICFQSVGYLIAIAVANLFFNLGEWVEDYIRPSKLNSFRRWTFAAGCTFSVLLPFAIPLVVSMQCLSMQQ